MKKELTLFSLLIVMISASACAANVSATVGMQQSEATQHIPTVETAAPSPEPEYEIGNPVTIEGKNVVSYLVRDEICVKNAELKDACAYDINTEERYVPVMNWAMENGIGILYDEEQDHYYFTRAAGSWTYPAEYDVPVILYYDVQPDEYGAGETTIKVTDFENQMEYLRQNGFTPIWFEDLEHIDEIEKPVILTFDGGYSGDYNNIYPILSRYNFKGTFFVSPDQIGESSEYLTEEQLEELSRSELVQIQSNTMSHSQLDMVDQDQQDYELNQSKLEITRRTNQIPYVLAYPHGTSTSFVDSQIENGLYRFGLKETGMRAFNTSDDCYTVWRFYPTRSTTLEQYAELVDSAFDD